MDEQSQDHQQEPINHSYVLIQDMTLKTHHERLTIEMGGERKWGTSVLAAQHNDENIASRVTN